MTAAPSAPPPTSPGCSARPTAPAGAGRSVLSAGALVDRPARAPARPCGAGAAGAVTSMLSSGCPSAEARRAAQARSQNVFRSSAAGCAPQRGPRRGAAPRGRVRGPPNLSAAGQPSAATLALRSSAMLAWRLRPPFPARPTLRAVRRGPVAQMLGSGKGMPARRVRLRRCHAGGV
jgi:hypothetical protein